MLDVKITIPETNMFFKKMNDLTEISRFILLFLRNNKITFFSFD